MLKKGDQQISWFQLEMMPTDISCLNQLETTLQAKLLKRTAGECHLCRCFSSSPARFGFARRRTKDGGGCGVPPVVPTVGETQDVSGGTFKAKDTT